LRSGSRFAGPDETAIGESGKLDEICQQHADKPVSKQIFLDGAPYGTRTRVFAVRGRHRQFAFVHGRPPFVLIYIGIFYIQFAIARPLPA
jgi:hypothetical protein